MTEVDTIFTIKQPYSLFRIHRTLLKNKCLEEVQDFNPFINKYRHLPVESDKGESLNALLEDLIQKLMMKNYLAALKNMSSLRLY